MAFLRSLVDKVKPWSRFFSRKPYIKPEVKEKKSQCSTCYYCPTWSASACKAQIEIHNPGYATDQEVFPKVSGNCNAYMNHQYVKTKPVNEYVVIRFNDDNVVTDVLAISSDIDWSKESDWFFNSPCWVVDTRKFPTPLVGAKAVFDSGKREASNKAELKWREPKHKYGTDVLGKTRHAKATFRDTNGLR
jgi:hypothetical protein